MKAPLLLALAVLLAARAAAAAGYIHGTWAVLRGMEKIAGRISTFPVKVGTSMNFGTLTVKVESCVYRPPEESPADAVFMRLTDNRQPAIVYEGWMFAASPSLAAVDHPIFDVWLLKCQNSPRLAAPPPSLSPGAGPGPAVSEGDEQSAHDD
ncbi:hypothetical protein FACS1894186_7710 [Alphaproteobacteria bacterium]|nr:hypothetical protein FACS1894186_7710 [Alphaproteobacteria bacterium]